MTVDLRTRYLQARERTEALAAPLSAEDQTAQSMPDVSPTKWHRAHTTWFFETFLLQPHTDRYQLFDPAYGYLFNSYYEAVGPRHPRAERGVITRPGIDQVAAYRRHVDEAMDPFLDPAPGPDLAWLVELGVQHEQQHQELLLMDVKHVLSRNVTAPVYAAEGPHVRDPGGRSDEWCEHPGGLAEVGHDGSSFAFDNERPRHRHHLVPFALASGLVTNADWLAFVEDGGYERPDLWLSDGWWAAQADAWEAPLYWRRDGDSWWQFTLRGEVPLALSEPVCHVSYYEADAFARWAGARLPTEHEWEAMAGAAGLAGMFGQVWQWTASAYLPFPGFRAEPGAVGEYNGKFMVNQHVLRGSCCYTAPGHERVTYRNFFPPGARWACAGLRLARDLEPGARA